MSRAKLLSRIGPGIAVAATGVGAGDIVSAAVAGSRFGLVVVWAALLGALLKFVMAEGVARWQLATGTTILEGWITRLARPVGIYFLVYMIIWSFVVGGALISACGLAAHALVPGVSYIAWGWIHSLVAVVFVWFGRYTLFENAMKLFVGMMFVGIVASFAQAGVPMGDLMRGLAIPRVPHGSIGLLLAVIGGVGGTITLLSYSYW
ncbi:MAG: Nramp family divalent metal transporter, partial [Gemmatimonadetes bacterium]|nr:Nramp family divalent metal transporter [Gemmatimonadota bacterium]